MKIKNIVTILLVTFILTSCAPIAKVTPTETAVPTSTFTPVPPTPTIMPTPSPENITDSKDLAIWVDDYVHAFNGKFTVNNMEMSASQLTDEIRSNSKKFTQLKTINGVEYLFIVVNDVPLAMQENNSKWEKATFAKIARKMGIDVTIRMNSNSGKIVPQIATALHMEYGDPYTLFNENFDWSKVTSNWDYIQDKLLQGSIPYQIEVFNWDSFGYGQIKEQIRYVKSNDMAYKGDTLFMPSYFFKHPTYANLAPDEQKKILFFMAAAKLLQYPEITKIDLVSELFAWELWGKNPEENRKKIRDLGGVDFLADLAQFVKQVRPDVNLIVAEDLINYNCLCYQYLYNGINTQQYNNFFAALKALKEKKAPIDGVKIENNFWLYAPPNREFIDATLEKIKGLGYELSSPDTIVGIDSRPPFSDGYIPPIKITPLPEGITATQKQAEFFALALDAYLDAGAKNFGFGSASDDTGDMFQGYNQKPRLAYYEVLRILYEHVP